MNIPNFFSVLRIVLIPFFIILLSYDYPFAAFTVFIFAAITDICDGFFARLLDQKTVLGAYLDPIADKLLLVSSFVTLVLIGLIPLWLAVLVPVYRRGFEHTVSVVVERHYNSQPYLYS